MCLLCIALIGKKPGVENKDDFLVFHQLYINSQYVRFSDKVWLLTSFSTIFFLYFLIPQEMDFLQKLNYKEATEVVVGNSNRKCYARKTDSG